MVRPSIHPFTGQWKKTHANVVGRFSTLNWSFFNLRHWAKCFTLIKNSYEKLNCMLSDWGLKWSTLFSPLCYCGPLTYQRNHPCFWAMTLNPEWSRACGKWYLLKAILAQTYGVNHTTHSWVMLCSGVYFLVTLQMSMGFRMRFLLKQNVEVLVSLGRSIAWRVISFKNSWLILDFSVSLQRHAVILYCSEWESHKIVLKTLK